MPLYISEPLVSAQAIRHLLSVSSLVHLLDALHLHICAGVVTAGSLGEIISPIFMLMAVAAASNTEPASPPSSATPTPMKKVKHDTNAEPDAGIQPDTSVSTDQLDDPHLFATVSEFVQALGCTSIVQSDDQSTKARPIPHELAIARVNFNHFIGITYTPSAEDLKEAFVRRAAFVAMHEQRGADRFIPILLNAGREEPFDIQDSDISVIYIQDKNHQEQESSWEYSATWKLSHRFVHQHSQTSSAESFGNRPYVSIYCQWGNSVDPQLRLQRHATSIINQYMVISSAWQDGDVTSLTVVLPPVSLFTKVFHVKLLSKIYNRDLIDYVQPALIHTILQKMTQSSNDWYK